MGDQREKTVSGSIARTIIGAILPNQDKPFGAAGAVGLLWNKLPRILNMARSRMRSDLRHGVLDYEPIHLHISPAELNPFLDDKLASAAALTTEFALGVTATGQPPAMPGMQPQRLALESFRFLMDQVPAIRTIEFSGRNRDPLENRDLVKMVDYAHKFNGAEITLVTDGLLLQPYTEDLLKSRLHALVIRFQAHRPSAYAAMSGQPLSGFVKILENTEHLLKRKQALKSMLEVELSMMVDIHHYRQIPEMIRFAETLGVDGIRFENYVSPDPAKKSDKTLYSHQANVKQYLDDLKNTVIKSSRLLVTLPVLMDLDMSGHRHCLEAYGTVSVDAEFNVSGCSRQLMLPEKNGKIWEEDFFNNGMYQWLRSIHNAKQEPCNTPVPLACQSCPRNMPSSR